MTRARPTDSSDEDVTFDLPAFVAPNRGGNLTLDLFILHQHLGSLLEEAMAGTGVSPSQYAVYSQIAQGSTSPKGLIDVLGLRPATLSGYLNAMELRGDLVRSRDPADGRAHRVRLTAQGRSRYDECRVELRKILRSLTACLGGTEAVMRARTEVARIDRALNQTRAGVRRRRP